MLVCLCGVSGSGKNTLLEEVLSKWDAWLMPTCTTRPMRKTEFHGQPYLFLSKKEFAKKQKRGAFVEVEEVHKGTMYGTMWSVYQEMDGDHRVLIKDIDVKGILKLKQKGLDVVSVFIKAPSLKELERRLILRGNTKEDIALRLSRAQMEQEHEKSADYVVVNDDLQSATKELERIIKVEAEKRGIELEKNTRRRVVVVYNSKAGKGKAQKYARRVAEEFFRASCVVSLVHSESEESIKEYFQNRSVLESGTTVVVVGGDGTLGSTVDAVLKKNDGVSVAVLPCGTANDFSRAIGAKRRVSQLVKLVLEGQPAMCDVALVNNSVHCVHAVGAGSFGHGSMEFSSLSKKWLGVLAYWWRCFLRAFKMQSQRLAVEVDGTKIDDEFLFFYVTNGMVAGGFHAFAPTADVSDGKFDFVGIKKCNFFAFCFVVFQILFGKHKKNKRVVILKGQKICVKAVGNVGPNFVSSDVDGNKGPNLPLKIEIIPKKIKIYSEKLRKNSK